MARFPLLPAHLLPAPLLPGAVLPAAAALVFFLATRAGAQILPETGTTVQVGNLRQQLEGLLATGADVVTAPGWTIVPAVGLEQRWTDHLQGVGSPEGDSSFITALRPSVLVNGQTARTTMSLSYAPDLEYYSVSGHQNRINQNLNASSHAILVPEHLFLDLRGFAGLQAINSGSGSNPTTAEVSQNETQTMSFSVHPYLRQRFGDLGVAELGATWSRSTQDNLSGTQANGSSGQHLTSEQEYFSLSSGPDFGRTSAALSVSANQGSGNGGVNNSRRDQATLSLGYAITRDLTALAGIGYEDIHYGGIPPFHYAGTDWDAGLRWIPNPDSSVTVTYGRQEGLESARLDASYAPTARTRVYARYSEGIATGMEQLLNAMNSSGVDQAGNSVSGNGTPVQLSNGFYGVQNNLSRVTSASLTATLLLERDAVSASFSRQQRRQLAAASAATAGALESTGYYSTLSWQRSLWPDLNAFAFVQWGTGENSSPGVPNQTYESLVVSLRLTYSVSETLAAYAQYSWTRQTYFLAAGSAILLPTNLVVIGARKIF